MAPLYLPLRSLVWTAFSWRFVSYMTSFPSYAKEASEFFPCTVPEGSGSLQDAHRFAFLQAIMEKKWTTEAEARKLFGELANLSGEGIASSELERFP